MFIAKALLYIEDAGTPTQPMHYHFFFAMLKRVGVLLHCFLMSPFVKVIHVCIFLRVINKSIELRFALLTYTVVKPKSLSVWIHCLFDHTESFVSHLKCKVLQSFFTVCCLFSYYLRLPFAATFTL